MFIGEPFHTLPLAADVDYKSFAVRAAHVWVYCLSGLAPAGLMCHSAGAIEPPAEDATHLAKPSDVP